MKLAITRVDQLVGHVTIDIDRYPGVDIAKVADEDGLSDLAAMGSSTIPEGYDWTGDEVYEIVAE